MANDSLQEKVTDDERFWTERSVPGSASWPQYRGRALKRYQFVSERAREKRVIDVASGTGYGSFLLATEGEAQSVLGLDVSQRAVEYATANFMSNNLSFRVADGQQLRDLDVGPVDLVSSMGTLEHIECPRDFAKGVHHQLVEGGIWLVTMLNSLTHPENEKDPYHYQEWTDEEFRRFLEEQFSQVELFWLVINEVGVNKKEYNRRRLQFIPLKLRLIIKTVLGRHVSDMIASRTSRALASEDYLWSKQRRKDAIEFMAVCTK